MIYTQLHPYFNEFIVGRYFDLEWVDIKVIPQEGAKDGCITYRMDAIVSFEMPTGNKNKVSFYLNRDQTQSFNRCCLDLSYAIANHNDFTDRSGAARANPLVFVDNLDRTEANIVFLTVQDIIKNFYVDVKKELQRLAEEAARKVDDHLQNEASSILATVSTT